jgi:hypothetical protein
MHSFKTVLTATLILIIFSATAQEFEVPKDYSLKKKEDYTKYEKDIIACINWLEETPLNQQEQKRKAANKLNG